MGRLEDPLERDGSPFGDATHRRPGTLEPAEDDLVFVHEQRAEVTHAVSVCRGLGGAGCDALIEGDEVGLVHAGPEAFGQVFGPVWMSHTDNLGLGARR